MTAKTCADCLFWIGRCSEPTKTRQEKINKIASDEKCSKFMEVKRIE